MDRMAPVKEPASLAAASDFFANSYFCHLREVPSRPLFLAVRPRSQSDVSVDAGKTMDLLSGMH